MKGMKDTYAHGFAALFTGWQLYAAIAAGIVGMFLLQSAMNAGRLISAQPGVTLSDPIVSILWGVVVFGESTRGERFIALAVISALVMAAAVVVLAGSPLLEDDQGQPEQERAAADRRSVRDAAARDGGRR